MFFMNVNSIEELKKVYRNLAKQHHPDHGGNVETMKQINAEYETAFKKLNAKEDNKHDLADGYREVINKVINLNGLDIEICGAWIWVSGNTYGCRETLKEAGFMWANKKKMWYWRPEEAACHSRKSQDMNIIREKYGSEQIKSSSRVYALN